MRKVSPNVLGDVAFRAFGSGLGVKNELRREEFAFIDPTTTVRTIRTRQQPAAKMAPGWAPNGPRDRHLPVLQTAANTAKRVEVRAPRQVPTTDGPAVGGWYNRGSGRRLAVDTDTNTGTGGSDEQHRPDRLRLDPEHGRRHDIRSSTRARMRSSRTVGGYCTRATVRVSRDGGREVGGVGREPLLGAAVEVASLRRSRIALK